MVDVTVLLPVYNGEAYLRETLDSILSQTYTNFEFLIVDDGSTDSSGDIISSFNDSRIKVLRNPERLKLSGALNRGIKEAKGNYIARMDGDDIAYPRRLERQVEFLNNNPEIGVCGTAIEIFGSVPGRVDIYPASHSEIQSYSLFDCPFCHPTVMLRKNLFDKFDLYYDGSFYPTEDFELWTRAVKCFPTANLREVLLRYRVHEKSMTGADWDEMDKQAARAIEPLLNQLGADCSDDELQFHRNIGRGRSCRLQDISEIDRAEKWLLDLARLNDDKKIYDQTALATILSTVWYRLCMNSSRIGPSVLTGYRKSILAKGEGAKRSTQAKRISILTASVLKGLIPSSKSN